jgi:prepilin-type N-terminal cleavage/methylation domain-containing protein
MTRTRQFSSAAGDRAVGRTAGPGFTLVETLVTVAIVALLIAMLLPALRVARISARLATAHVELRGIELALFMYSDDHRGALPPSRFSCSMRSADEMPLELAQQQYLPGRRKRVQDRYTRRDFLIDAVDMRDVFDPGSTYRYRAVGAALLNETVLIEAPDGARLWIPDSYPDCRGEEGRYYGDPRTSPVRYAIWSIGPDPNSPKFRKVGGHLPIPARFWAHGASDTGLIVHFQGHDGRQYQSP